MGKPYINNSIQIDLPAGQSVHFDVDAFDQGIRTHGVELVHYQAMICPVGLIDKDDFRKPHEHHENCSNGYVYEDVGVIRCLFTGNSMQSNMMDVGKLDGSQVQVTFPRFYEKSYRSDCADLGPEQPFNPAPADRFFVKQSEDSAPIVVPHWQLVQASATGIDRLRFPAISVVSVMDSSGKKYHSGDYTIENGKIRWANGPGIDPRTNNGMVYSIRFLYRPFWYLSRMVHQVRVANSENEFTGDRSLIRMPQMAVLAREYIYENERNDPESPPSPRKEDPPTKPIFGERF